MKQRNKKTKSLKLNRQQISNLNTIFGGVDAGASTSKAGAREPKKTIGQGSCNLLCITTTLFTTR